MRWHIHLRSQLLTVLLLMAFWPAAAVQAQAPQLRAETNTYTVDIGVVAAADLRKRPEFIDRHKDFHGEALYAPNMHHLTVAVADRKTGTKVQDATVIATIRHQKQREKQRVERPLERMVIGDTISYGNFFRMADAGSYEIHLKIYRPQATAPEVAIFSYTKAQD